jgi:hypothetical protein
MPNSDGTGPNGQGSFTGRGMGNCKPSPDKKAETDVKRPQGKRLGCGFGRGRGKNN